MVPTTSRVLHRRVLIVDDEILKPGTAAGRSVRALADELRERNCEVVEALSVEDGIATVTSDAAIHCVFIDWTLGQNDSKTHEAATTLLRKIRARDAKVPIFLMADRAVSGTLTVEVATLSDELVWLLGDTASFIAGRAQAAMDRYLDQLLPPYAAALMHYNRERE